MLTGAQYKETLDDGRATYFEGERVKDLVGHPILGKAVDRVAYGYDFLAERSANGESPIMGVPTSPEELRSKTELVHHAGMMAHVTYTSIMTLATASSRMADSNGEGVERMNAFVEEAKRKDLRITQCITDAKGDRSRPPGKQDDPDAHVRGCRPPKRRCDHPRRQTPHHRRLSGPRADDNPHQGDESR